mgnify:CR=1 FL=1
MNTDLTVLIVEDDPHVLLGCQQALALEDIPSEGVGSAEEALARIGDNFAGIVISDIRLPGIDGKAKMSKSIGNCIYLCEKPEDIEKKVMSMFTDPTHLRRDDPGHVEGNPVFTYLDAFCKDEYFAEFLPEYKNLDEMKEHYTRGGLGDVKVKRFLNNVMQAELAPIRERRQHWEQHLDDVVDVLRDGTEKAAAKADGTLQRVRKAMRINYFEDGNLLK